MGQDNLNDISEALEALNIPSDVRSQIGMSSTDTIADVLIQLNSKKPENIIFGSYVGNGTNQITIQIPENQCFFVMLSDVNGEPGNCINIEYTGHTYTPWAVRGFVEQIGYASNQGAVYYVYDNGTYMAYIQRYSNAQNGELVFDIGKSYTGIQSYYNISGKTYHYATIGV